MERRVFIAISLSILVIYAYQVYLAPRPDPAKASRPAPAAAPADTPSPSGVTTAPQPNLPVEAAPAPITADTNEHEIVVETAKVQAVITNRGGRILHWRLKEYPDPGGKPVDLVPSNLPAAEARPFSLAVDDPGVTRRLNESLYRVSGAGAGRVDATRSPVTLTFEFQDEAGLHARKEIRFEPDSYLVTLSSDVRLGAQRLTPAIQWGPGLGDLGAATAGGSFFTGNYVQPPSAIFHRDGEVERITPDKVGESPAHEAAFLFAGVDDHYFLVAALEPGQSRLEYKAVTVAESEGMERRLVVHSIRPADASRPIRYFAGPKQLETLQGAGINGQLANAINFGIFTWLVIPLLHSLTWVYGFIGNYGWSIIILTILINLVMFPLRHKSLVSMRKTQAIMPLVKGIQERYADLKMTDPARQKMNTEIMNLYREKGVNPAAGCVPMLLTMPVLFAFYSMLSQAIELRGADFGWWIHDLSLKDPFYVTPLLMGATMFWQMWMSPTTVDPAQQRMMMFMPVVFTVMFLGFPSGLAIYYLVSNLCQIAQQYATNRLVGPPALQPARTPAAGRALKNVGAGRTEAAQRK
jgi:YidC/Oxa1 family membrane protein insertase